MEPRPPPERLWMARFTVHATRGLIREPRARRRVMAILLGFALVMVIAGLSALGPWLDSREHPVRFILFWFACGWVTLTAFLLAIADLLLVRAESRRARKALEEEAAGSPEINPPD